KTCSKGMRQRLGLAQRLLGRPKMLLLDEPNVGLDPIATIELYQLIGRLRDERSSIIICSHVLPGVERYIDKAVILARGRLEAAGNLEQLRKHVGLSVRIRINGPGADFKHPQLLEHQPLAGNWHEYSVPAAAKLSVLQELLKLPLEDI